MVFGRSLIVTFILSISSQSRSFIYQLRPTLLGFAVQFGRHRPSCQFFVSLKQPLLSQQTLVRNMSAKRKDSGLQEKSEEDSNLIRKMSAKRKNSGPQEKIEDDHQVEDGETSPSPTKKTKEETRPYFNRDPVLPKPIPSSMPSLKIISWNIPGLRAAVKNSAHVIQNLIVTHQPDILCLQETKIQDTHIEEFESHFNQLGYRGFWSCSTTKKGYSGTAVLVKEGLTSPDLSIRGTIHSVSATPVKATKLKSKSKSVTPTLESFFKSPSVASRPASAAAAMDVSSSAPPDAAAAATPAPPAQPVRPCIRSVELDTQHPTYTGEGRLITVELDSMYLVAAYVPNSGQGLERLDYRVDGWDVYIREYLNQLRATGKGVVYCGDMNVGHLDVDIYNHTAKHIVKQAGLTPRERASFTKLLEGGYVDAFRHFYPAAQGQFTYWSQRTFARNVNCGLRLDYFVCSDDMFAGAERAERDRPGVAQVLDSYILHEDTVGCSDHCPVVLIVSV